MGRMDVKSPLVAVQDSQGNRIVANDVSYGLRGAPNVGFNFPPTPGEGLDGVPYISSPMLC